MERVHIGLPSITFIDMNTVLVCVFLLVLVCSVIDVQGFGGNINYPGRKVKSKVSCYLFFFSFSFISFHFILLYCPTPTKWFEFRRNIQGYIFVHCTQELWKNANLKSKIEVNKDSVHSQWCFNVLSITIMIYVQMVSPTLSELYRRFLIQLLTSFQRTTYT